MFDLCVPDMCSHPTGHSRVLSHWRHRQRAGSRSAAALSVRPSAACETLGMTGSGPGTWFRAISHFGLIDSPANGGGWLVSVGGSVHWRCEEVAFSPSRGPYWLTRLFPRIETRVDAAGRPVRKGRPRLPACLLLWVCRLKCRELLRDSAPEGGHARGSSRRFGSRQPLRAPGPCLIAKLWVP
ncbi:hypothetical protein LZ30DRAFT_718089 [Colletotrichum cereale]|nr:hypothetical protein LZ30DRAFT_718089 [Colletotrichum cereale]